tara:strand:- start:2907 stop:3167 length:261 start_codon:yes stop_codon:yes gene_type:complete
MSRKNEYLAVRHDRGTLKRLDDLKDYIGGACLGGPVPVDDVTRSETMRELTNFALTVFERRAAAWRAEQPPPPRSGLTISSHLVLQ